MYQRKLMKRQIESQGLRLGDSCRISPLVGKKKTITLTRHRLDLVSAKYRPENLSMSFIELPNSDFRPFHYRLELESPEKEGRFVLKTIEGEPFWLNGTAVREAYIERMDRLFIDDNRLNFDPFDLTEALARECRHPILLEESLLSSDLKILIQGETGTGKTYLASKIHELSRRHGKFVAVNLSSFNPQLIESELFGHKKGSFTGAHQDKVGAFEEAEAGTLFLDEVDSLPIEVQTKLLTFLDEHTFRRVGDMMVRSIRTRLIFAAGRKLETLVQKGSFRQDFYYRLKAGHTVELGSLRNNPQRIREACAYFSVHNDVTLSLRLLDFYQTLAWPGNLRQLNGHLEKKRILSKSRKIDFDHLDEELLRESSNLMDMHFPKEIVPMKDLKAEYVKRALTICEGNISQAARCLRLTEKTVKSIVGRNLVCQNVS
jgi:transcriptional regulator of acetoin/glycerol metabolism